MRTWKHWKTKLVSPICSHERTFEHDFCLAEALKAGEKLAANVKDAASEKFDEAKKAGEKLASDAKAAAGEKFDEAKKAGEKLAANAKDAASEKLDEAKKTAETLRKKASDTAEDLWVENPHSFIHRNVSFFFSPEKMQPAMLLKQREKLPKM